MELGWPLHEPFDDALTVMPENVQPDTTFALATMSY
ncbi:hypothetical protein PC116_g20160, partial [Phytophthora cactorum]